MDAYDAALAYAHERGTEAGSNAAAWFAQETIGGRATGDVTRAARILIEGIEDGDPAVLDSLPTADLSGEWAGALTGPELEADALAHAGVDDVAQPGASGEWFSDICDAYEYSFSQAVEDCIRREAKDVLEV